MTRLPIRVRLAAVFAVAMVLVLAGAGWFVYDRVAFDLSRALDQELRGRAQDLAALVRRGGTVSATRGSLVEAGESFAELLDGSGRVVDATPPIRRSLLTTRELARAGREPTFLNRSSVPGLDEPARLLAVPVVHERRRLVLVAGTTRENRAETLRSLRTAFLIGGPIALLLASLAAYVLAGAALRPIEAMRRRAAAISSSSLDDRLPLPRARDEVARLGETLNQMLARLEAGLARERRFIADASHQLRTPLALLKTELELALRRRRSRGELEQAVRSAAATTDRLARLADDLLLLAGGDDGRVPLATERVDVLDALDAVARTFAARAEAERRSLVVDGDGALVVTADRLRLEQALSNMVDNAFRHAGGRITLAARARDAVAELHVVDNGAGFPPAFVEQAFDRFSRANGPERDGSGLGLAIVETIAHAHRGTAHACNRPEGGADVWLALPL